MSIVEIAPGADLATGSRDSLNLRYPVVARIVRLQTLKFSVPRGDRVPDIEFVKPHSLTIAKAKALVQKTADALAAEYDLNSEWHGDTLHFHRSGVDGRMHVTDSEVRLQVTLGFLLKAFKGTLGDHIERNFDKLLADTTSSADKDR
jgi:putative polyhydroxyalkanoate system protein